MTAKHICITGVTRGLGQALVRKFDALGHKLSGCGRDACKLDDLGAKLQNEHFFSKVDIANFEEVQSWASNSIQRLGPPDILINNAGMINPNAKLWEIDTNAFQSLININLSGAFYVIKSFVPHMLKQDRGIIINISSMAGRVGFPEIAPYCASKHAIEGLTKALAKELPASITTLAIDPGGINTDMLKSHRKAAAEDHESPTEWVERAAPYILSIDHSANGQCLSLPS